MFCSTAAKRAAIFMALCGLCAGLAGRSAAAIVEFPIPSGGGEVNSITCGPDGAYWFVEFTGNRIGRIDTNGVITEYSVPTGASLPYDIVTGPDGTNLWFTEAATSKLGRIGTNGAITEFQLPFTITGTGITVGPDPTGFGCWILAKTLRGESTAASWPSPSATAPSRERLTITRT